MAKKSNIPFIHESGTQTGTPLLFFHGFPGCHKQAVLFDPWAEKLGLRILAVDRPGYAYSDPQPRTTLKDFLKGLEVALQQRNVDRFYVIGLSGGNPAAVATAGHFGDRVIAFGSVCGLAPFTEALETFSTEQQKGLTIARRTPEFILRPIVEQILNKFQPELKLDTFIAKLGPADQAVLSDEKVRSAILESMELARRHGSAGIIFDLKSYTSAWPFLLSQLTCPFLVWHGEKDKILSPKMAQFIHSQVKHSKLKLFEDEGHYSLPIQRTEQILTELMSAQI